MITRLLYSFLPGLLCLFANAQRNLLRQQVRLNFTTDGACAPVDVTEFIIIYTFNVAQDPNDIIIRFIWNDPATTVYDIDFGSGFLIVTAGNTVFEATGPLLITRAMNE